MLGDLKTCLLTIGLFLLYACGNTPDDPSEKLHDLFAREQAFRDREFPGPNDGDTVRMAEVTEEAMQRRAAFWEQGL